MACTTVNTAKSLHRANQQEGKNLTLSSNANQVVQWDQDIFNVSCTQKDAIAEETP